MKKKEYLFQLYLGSPVHSMCIPRVTLVCYTGTNQDTLNHLRTIDLATGESTGIHPSHYRNQLVIIVYSCV